MFNIHFPSILEIALLLPAIVLGLTFHELAHGWVAYKLGDNTARYAGRLTINPIAHIDPIGLILLFLAGFGWAKPVPVNPNNLKGDTRRGMMLVSLAGPATNILIAIIGAVILGLGGGQFPYGEPILILIIRINVVLAIFNLIPIPPLDGSKILAGLIPGRQEWLYHLETYGIVILLALMFFTDIIGKVLYFFITPIVDFLLYTVAGTIASLF
ncbi:site-2 protease family protein [Desulfolucanica intricata]|uniref:site-2 protease family protein n=1 Tax=Desulfolucanica intricata TaxID=1285191 RepID=UPI00082BDFDE|nr:site-2 protease family protein [Desulfolucanica intricata]